MDDNISMLIGSSPSDCGMECYPPHLGYILVSDMSNSLWAYYCKGFEPCC
jgi:hypothetical protein